MQRNHTTIHIGTRRSKLATWQATTIKSLLEAHHPELTVDLVFINTQGDQILDKPLAEIGGKGVFTYELEQALLNGGIDLAVHSLKDLPTELDPAFTVGAIPAREEPFDALVSRNDAGLDDLPEGAVIGTSSLRRRAQLLAYRPDLRIIDIRGNVGTRLNKTHDPEGPYDATMLAVAGLKRLEIADAITEVLDTSIMLPAPAQGAIGV
ncbi:MAG: hydroxymethylbilane synthase, partial [Chloroflexi bacterium]|nr:hydroxymethylbilane synthase [Chloroflexota bacterium]